MTPDQRGKMPTFTAYTTLTQKTNADALAEALDDLEPEPTGIGAFEMEDGSGLWEIAAYFEAAPDQAGLALLAAVHDAKPFVISELPETDWVSKVQRDLSPVEAGRFFVYGSHDADKVPPDCAGSRLRHRGAGDGGGADLAGGDAGLGY